MGVDSDFLDFHIWDCLCWRSDCLVCTEGILIRNAVYTNSCPKCKIGAVEVDFNAREMRCVNCGYDGRLMQSATAKVCAGSGSMIAPGSKRLRVRDYVSYKTAGVRGRCRVCGGVVESNKKLIAGRHFPVGSNKGYWDDVPLSER